MKTYSEIREHDAYSSHFRLVFCRECESRKEYEQQAKSLSLGRFLRMQKLNSTNYSHAIVTRVEIARALKINIDLIKIQLACFVSNREMGIGQ